MTEPVKEFSPLERVQKRRADRKDVAAAARDDQLAIDLEAIDALESLHGDAQIKVIHVPHIAGMVAAVALRSPNAAELKRYRDGVKVRKNGQPGDPVEAHELIGSSCRVYPGEEAFDALCEKLTNIRAQVGVEAVALSTGEAEKKA